jgi:glycosyltransferase involved in cell wall biosynthesis
MPGVAVVVTTCDEGATIGDLMRDLRSQTLTPAEIVVVDASGDRVTMQALESERPELEKCGIVLIVEHIPGIGIAAGRNHAIAMCASDVVAVTDAGCRPHEHWLQRISQPLRLGQCDLVAGHCLPLAATRFELAVAALTMARRIPAVFNPSSRSIAFSKVAWCAAGGYPTHLPWGEDTLFNRLCVEAGARPVIVGDAVVRWRPRGSLKAVFGQYFRYSFGDGLSGRVRASYVRLYAVILVSILLATTGTGLWLMGVLLVGSTALVGLRLRREGVSLSLVPLALLLALVIQAARLVGSMAGAFRLLGQGGPTLSRHGTRSAPSAHTVPAAVAVPGDHTQVDEIVLQGES